MVSHTAVETKHKLRVLEIRVLRKIFGPIQCKEGWRIRSNDVFNHTVDNYYVVTFVLED